MKYKATREEWLKVMGWFGHAKDLAPKVYAVGKYEELKTKRPAISDAEIKERVTTLVYALRELPIEQRRREWAKYMTVPGINDKK